MGKIACSIAFVIGIIVILSFVSFEDKLAAILKLGIPLVIIGGATGYLILRNAVAALICGLLVSVFAWMVLEALGKI